MATWRGSQVAVKTFGEDVITDEDKVWVGPLMSMGYNDLFLVLTLVCATMF